MGGEVVWVAGVGSYVVPDARQREVAAAAGLDVRDLETPLLFGSAAEAASCVDHLLEVESDGERRELLLLTVRWARWQFRASTTGTVASVRREAQLWGEIKRRVEELGLADTAYDPAGW